MKVLINCITHDIKTCNNGCLMQDHWINDLSNCITDDLTTCNNGGLRKKISLFVFLYDFPSFLTIALALVNMQIPISAYGIKRRVSKL